jgi:hypothetical protein
VVVVVSRAQVVERNVAGGYATTQGWLAFMHTLALFAIYGVIVFFLFVAKTIGRATEMGASPSGRWWDWRSICFGTLPPW